MNWFRKHLSITLYLYWLALLIFVVVAHAIPVTSYSVPVSSELEGKFFESIRLMPSFFVFSMVAGIAPAIIISGGLATEPFTAYNILVLIISLILSCLIIGWVLKQKGKSLTWLLCLFMPFGLLVFDRIKKEGCKFQ